MNARAMRTTASRVDDDAVVAQVRDGDGDAFALLVERYKRPVYGLAYRMLGNASDAEDAAQETFVRAYTRLCTYQPDGRFGAWLLSITSHWCIDFLRTRGRRGPTIALGRVQETERFISQSDGPEEHALRDAGCDEIQGWLAELPHNYRLVLTLRYFHELSYNEIAATIGEPVSTVRMRLFRARALFQKLARQGQARETQSWATLEHSAA